MIRNYLSLKSHRSPLFFFLSFYHLSNYWTPTLCFDNTRNDLQLSWEVCWFPDLCLWNPWEVRTMKMPGCWEKVELKRSWAPGLLLSHQLGQLSFIYWVSTWEFFCKKYFPLIKKRRRKRRGMKERKKESAEGEDLMMCFQSYPNLESCSFWLERVSIVWQRKTPFFPSSCRFSHKTRHCGSGFSVINNLSTSQRWDTPPRDTPPPNLFIMSPSESR